MLIVVDNRVTLQAPEPLFKSAGLQTFKTSCTECDELRDEYIRITVTVSVLLQSPARVTEHQGDRVDVRGGNARVSGASDGKGSVTS